MLQHREFDIAIRALGSGEDELLKSDECICLNDFDSVVGYKTRNEFREMTNLADQIYSKTMQFKLPVREISMLFLYVCYKNFGEGEKLYNALNRYLGEVENRWGITESGYFIVLLLLEVFEHLGYWKYDLYYDYMSLKTDAIQSKSDQFSSPKWVMGFHRKGPDPSRTRIHLFMWFCDVCVTACVCWFTATCSWSEWQIWYTTIPLYKEHSRQNVLCTIPDMHFSEQRSNIDFEWHHWSGRRLFSVCFYLSEVILGIEFSRW